MKIDRKIYWDTTCWLAWLLDERIWPANVLTGIQDVVYEVEGGTALLFTSAVTRGEIYFGKLTLDQKHAFANLLRRRNVTEISADPRVMDRASQIREYHSARGQRVLTPDATHLATAVLYRADEFQTMDGLRPGKTKRGLLKLNGDVGGFNLRVINPYPRTHPLAKKLLIEGPLIEKIEELDAEQQKEARTQAGDTTQVQADGSSSTGNATGTEEEKGKK